jgi:hypothetical protein
MNLRNPPALPPGTIVPVSVTIIRAPSRFLPYLQSPDDRSSFRRRIAIRVTETAARAPST